jgi:hypothetical protein
MSRGAVSHLDATISVSVPQFPQSNDKSQALGRSIERPCVITMKLYAARASYTAALSI